MAVSLPAVGIRFQAQGADGVVYTFKRIEDAATRSGRVVGSIGLSADAARNKSVAAAQGIANALEGVARTGETGGAAIRQMVSQVGNLAFALGVGGPLTAAVGVAGLAIVQMIRNSREGIAELLGDIQKARLTSGQMAEEAARATLAKVREHLAKARAEEEEFKRATGGATTQALRGRIGSLEAAEAAQMETLERANRASAIARLDLLKKLKAANQANAQELGELAAIESRLARDMALGNLTIEERVGLLPEKAKAIKAEKDHAESLLELFKMGQLTGAQLGELNDRHAELTAQINSGTLALDKYVEALKKRKAIEDALAIPRPSLQQTPGVSTTPRGAAGRVDITAEARRQLASGKLSELEIAELMRIEAVKNGIADSIASALTNGIADGFARAVASGSFGEGFKALTDSFLSSFGAMVVQIGQQALKALILESTIVKALASMNPAFGIPAALALIALGGSMMGAGSRAGGGAAGGGFSSAPTRDTESSATRLRINGGLSRGVTPRAATVVNLQTVNPNDPATQRLLASAVGNYEKRSA